MDVRATKSAPEREDEEYERLVRPAPKVKPPRRDLRREQVDTDRDPDTDGDPDISGDPDRSKNYKDVGGSIAARVFLRFAEEGKITVRRKEDGKVVQINEDTLKERGSEYEEIKDDEGVRDEKSPQEPEESLPEPVPPGEDADKAELGRYLKDLAKGYLPLKKHLDSLLDPDSFVGGIATKDPDTPVERMFPEYRFPKGLTTLGDVIEALGEAEKSGKPKTKKEPPPPASEEEKKAPKKKSPEPKPEKPKEEAPKLVEEPAKEAPEEKEDVPPTTPELPEAKTPEEKAQEERFDRTPDVEPEVAPVEGDPKSPLPETEKEPPPPAAEPEATPPKAKGKSKGKAAPPAEPPRREASAAEHEDAVMLVSDTFPPEVASEILSKFSHPDDLERVVANYKAASEHMKVKDVKSFTEDVSDFFQTDPAKIEPPKTWKDASGKEKPFKSLSAEEQAEATRQHQLDVVGISLAAKDKLARNLRLTSFFGKPQVPQELANTLADFLLRKGDEQAADKVGKRLFDAALKGGGMASDDVSGKTAAVDPKVVKKLFGQLPPEAHKVASSYLEGLDYRVAKDKFLGKDGFSEWDSPKKIFSGIKAATDFFSNQGKMYGQGENHNGKLMFRVGVLHRLRAIDPEKYAKVRKLVAEYDDKHYAEAAEKWKKDHQKWEERKTKFEAGRGPYRAKSFDEPEPVEPKKPGSAKRTVAEGKDLLESVKSRSKTAARVASRFISTCSDLSAMDRDPQRGCQDLGEPEARALVAKAEAWLHVPVLNDNIDGVSREKQLRAALDLAIKQSPQAGQVDGATYSNLLTRLGGTRVSSCLPPRREVIPMSRSARIRKFASRAAKSDPALAYDLIEFADKYASDEQEEKKDQEPKDEEKGQSKEASTDKYTDLRSLVIRTAAADADAKRVLTPVLQLIKKQQG